MKYYTGIGHRDTPLHLKNYMSQLSKRLSLIGYTLRSGGSGGADTFFEQGVLGNKKEIYLPWRGFNGSTSDLFVVKDETKHTVERYFNNWKYAKTEFSSLKDTTQKLFTRNYYQLFGYDDRASDFVVYYADIDEKGVAMGGTGFTVYMANESGIPTYNLKESLGIKEVNNLVNKLKIQYMHSSIKHVYLFYKDDIDIEDNDNLEHLYFLPIQSFYKNLDNRNVLSIYFKKYKHLINRGINKPANIL